jgi:hypothetical protein
VVIRGRVAVVALFDVGPVVLDFLHHGDVTEGRVRSPGPGCVPDDCPDPGDGTGGPAFGVPAGLPRQGRAKALPVRAEVAVEELERFAVEPICWFTRQRAKSTHSR